MSKAVRLPQSATAPSAAATAAAPSATSATPSAFSNKPTAASKCVAVGDGLKHTTVNQFGIFTVQTRDAEGVPKEESDDDLVVMIRLVGGGEKLRTRMLNNKDGTFTVGYKPIVSGRYNVDVKLNNEPLPDSPYSCIVSTLTPSAAMSSVKGKALSTAVAREQQAFEINFRDLLGQTAHAEELEVYVETVHDSGAGADAAEGAGGPHSPKSPKAGFNKAELLGKLKGIKQVSSSSSSKWQQQQQQRRRERQDQHVHVCVFVCV